MSRKLVLFMSLIFLGQTFFALPITSDPQPVRALHTEGAHLINDLGDPVHLHGVCKNDFIEDSWGLMGDEAGVIANLDAMKDWGINFLALGIEVQWWLRNQDNIRENFQTVVELANERRIYVGIGVFGWDYPGPWGGNSAAQEIIANPDEYIGFWLNVSSNFKDSPNVLYNSLVEISMDEGQMNEYFNVATQAIQAIRANGDEHIFMYHEDYCGYPSRFDNPATEGGQMIRRLHEQPLDPDDPAGPRLTNIAYDAHTYRWHGTFGNNPDEFTLPGQVTNSDGVYRRDADSPPPHHGIEYALEHWGYYKILEEYQVPIIMWEGGAFADVYAPNSWEKEVTCWQNVLSIFNELDIGYGAFWWRATGPCALIDADLSPTEWGQVLIDSIATGAGPNILILSPENKTYATTDMPLIFTVDEPVSWIGYSLDGKANQTITGNTSLTSLLDGVHHVVVCANDTAGNMGASSIVYFSVDTTPPYITDVSQTPEDNVQPEDEVKVNATVTDDTSGVRQVTLNYTNGNGTWTTVEMTRIAGNVWNATIPPFPYNTNVTYVIMADDNINNTITTKELGHEYHYHVIPEFPTAIIIPLFMLATLLAVIAYRRKHQLTSTKK